MLSQKVIFVTNHFLIKLLICICLLLSQIINRDDKNNYAKIKQNF